MSQYRGVIVTYNPMKVKAVIYTNAFDPSDVLTQVSTFNDVTIIEDIYVWDNGQVTIPYIEWANDNERGCDLYEITGNEDRKIFDWYIQEVSPRFDWPLLMDVTLKSKKDILRDRWVITDITYNDHPAKALVSSLLEVRNTLGDWRVVDWSLYISSSEPLVTIDLKTGDNLHDIFDEIMKQIGWQWWYRDWKVIFASQLWYDYTTESSPTYIELYRNFATWLPSKIKDAKMRIIADRKNYIIWIDDSWTKHIAQNIVGWKVYGFSKENFRDWDLVNKTNAKLAELNRLQRLVQIESENFNMKATAGDKIKVRIEGHQISEWNMNSTVLIIKKSIRYADAVRSESITVWEYAIQERTLWNKLIEIRKLIDLKSI